MSEEVEGYYDNNNQYQYRIVEHVAAEPDPSISVGRGAAGSRRPQGVDPNHRLGAEAATGGDLDMTYEVSQRNSSRTLSVVYSLLNATDFDRAGRCFTWLGSNCYLQIVQYIQVPPIRFIKQVSDQ